MSKVYRESRSGMLGMAQACKLTYILSVLGKLISEETFESRLTALERKADELN
jgi:hypothetical protein